MKNISKKIIASAIVLSVLFVGFKANAQNSATSAVLNASVNPGGMQTTAWFEYGTNPNLTTWTETQRESVGAFSSARTFSQTVNNLQPNTMYYFRVATNNGYNTFRAQILSFTTGTTNTNNQVVYNNTPTTTNVTRYVVNETKYVDRVLAPQTVYMTGTQPMYYQQPVSYQYQPMAYQPTYQTVAYQPASTNVVYQPANQVVTYQQPTYQSQIAATTYKPTTTYTTQSATALAAAPVFGASFLPNSVFGWLVLIALIFAVVLVARRLARA
ncbi:MAG: hypothetical protein ACKOW9_02785 [Candidatus Paceibacterota bacterium]